MPWQEVGPAQKKGPWPPQGGIGRLAVALGVATVLTLVNPRGIDQHLTFLLSSSHSGALSIADEWARFNPFSMGAALNAGSALTWIVADMVLATVAGVTLIWGTRVARGGTLDSRSAALFGLAAASTIAMLAAVRFLWLGIFPILFVAHVSSRLAIYPARGERWDRWAAFAPAVMAIALLCSTNFRSFIDSRPRGVTAHLTSPYAPEKYYLEGVRFLAETGISGNLYNSYWLGSFVGYWLVPPLRTFVDGRTEHYPAEVLKDYYAIKHRRGVREGESFLDVLERREVDLFFGTGLPDPAHGGIHGYTAGHLEAAPGWLRVSRGVRHSIYLNEDRSNRATLDRIASYYDREGVPFSREHGFDPVAVIRERPDWAASHGILPRDWDGRIHHSEAGDVAARFEALDTLAICYAALGDYQSAIDTARRALVAQPYAKGPLRRMVYAFLRLDQPVRAERNARKLEALDPSDPLSQAALNIVSRYTWLTRGAPRSRDPNAGTRAAALLDSFPLLSPGETEELRRDFHWPVWEGNPVR